ncbi:hypothetical protein GCM10017750_00650 [Streptomyces racemochromogenes]
MATEGHPHPTARHGLGTQRVPGAALPPPTDGPRLARVTKRPPIRRPVGFEEQSADAQVSETGPPPGAVRPGTDDDTRTGMRWTPLPPTAAPGRPFGSSPQPEPHR